MIELLERPKMAKKQAGKPAAEGETGEKKSKKKATVQLKADLVFWINRLSDMEDESASDLIDPLLRTIVRQRLLKDHDTDPDVEWQKKLRAMARKPQE
jgi:hypothetical protein